MSVRAGYTECWPPPFTWDAAALYDEQGMACYATAAYLEARFGEPPTTPPAAIDSDVDLDTLLAELGYERVNA